MSRKLLCPLVAVLAVGATAMPAAAANATRPDANGDVVRRWTGLALDAVRATAASDATAARLYAMVDVAMYDAVNGLADEPRAHAIVPVPDARTGDPVVAAATAAHDVLVSLYGSRKTIYDAQLTADVSASPSGQAKQGKAWGAKVAAGVLAARSDDGSSGTEIQPAGSGPGYFRLSWDAHFRHLAPFAITDPQRYVDTGTPALGSAEYARAFNDVKDVGRANDGNDDSDATFKFWKLAGGTDQPAGAWLQVAQTVSLARSLSLEDTARLFALQSMAMADTVAPTYQTKFTFDAWRPYTAIAEAADDGNPDTEPPDPEERPWIARGGTSGSPEHYSGHSTFSAAAAEVLAGFFCTDSITFTLTTDAGGPSRTFSSFRQAAEQAGRSRVLGGQHFEFSNQAGLTAGRAIAEEVLATALLAHGRERLCDA